MEADSTFWKSLQYLQKENSLCDIQLTICPDEHSSVIGTINVHKVILVSNSGFFQNLLNSGELFDVYDFIGTSIESLQQVVDYMYRRISWVDLTKNTEAFNTAAAIEITPDDNLSSQNDLNSTSPVHQDLQYNAKISTCTHLVPDETKIFSVINPDTIEFTEKIEANDVQIETTKLKPNNEKSNIISSQKLHFINDQRRKTGPLDTDFECKIKMATDSFSPRMSQRRRKTISYKHLAEGRDPSEENPGLKHDEENMSSMMEDESIEPPKKKRGRPPKYSPFMMTIGQNLETVTESGDNSVTDPQDELQSPSNIDDDLSLKKTEETNIESESILIQDLKQGEPTLPINTSVVSPGGTNSETINTNSQSGSEEVIQNIENPVSEPNQSDERWPSEKGNPFPCDRCRRNLKSLGALAQHKKIIHGLKVHINCCFCEKQFESNHAMDKHLKASHQLTMYKCAECDMKFRSKEGCNQHWQKKHSGETPQIGCELCDKRFFSASELRSHMLYRHTESRDFACQLCTRAFKSKHMLQRHVNTYHSSIRRFKCDECDAMFKTLADCKSHRQKHFREKNPLSKGQVRGMKHPDNQNYKCGFCDKIFTKRTRLLVHENLQHKQKNDGTTFLCTICSKVFAIKHYLMQHIKHCHSERRFSCPNCQQTFAQKVDVKKHLSVAGRCKGAPPDPKPFSCPQCGRGFSLKGNLGKHLQRGRCRGANSRNPEVVVVLQQSTTDSAQAGEVDTTYQTTQTEDGLINQVVTNEEGVVQTLDVSALGEAQIIEIQQGSDAISLQGIVDGQVVPITMTTHDGEVRYQVVTTDLDQSQSSNSVYEQSHVLTNCGTTAADGDSVQGQAIHLMEGSVVQVTSQEQNQVYAEAGVIQSLVSHGLLTTQGENGLEVVQTELIVENGTDDQDVRQEGVPVFTDGEGNRVIIQGNTVIPIKKGQAIPPELVATLGDESQDSVEEYDGVAPQQILHIEVGDGFS